MNVRIIKKGQFKFSFLSEIMDLKNIFSVLFLFAFYGGQVESVLTLLECPEQEDKCRVLLACDDRDAYKMVLGIVEFEKEIDEIEHHKEKIEALNQLRRSIRETPTRRSLLEETYEAIGGGFISHFLSQFSPEEPLFIRKDMALFENFDYKKYHLLKIEEEQGFSNIIGNLSMQRKQKVFEAVPLWHIHDKESEGGPRELTSRRKASRGSAASGQTEGRKKTPVYFSSADEMGPQGLALGPGGSPPTKKPTLPTKPTPVSIVDLDSDGETGSEKSFDDEKMLVDFPDFRPDPVCYPDFVTRRLAVDPVEQLTVHRGLRWHTFIPNVSGYENTCNIDSFLTHMLLRFGQQEGYAQRYFRLLPGNEGHVAEQALIKALSYFEDSLATKANDPNSPDKWVKQAFIQRTALGTIYPIPPWVNHKTSRVVNMAGNEFQNIFELFRSSWTMANLYWCGCQKRKQHEYLAPFASFTPAILTWLNNNYRSNPSKLSFKDCKQCGGRFTHQSSMVGPATWFLPFSVNDGNIPPTAWPLTITLDNPDPRMQQDQVMFDLGYISFSTTDRSNHARGVTHHLSMHRFGDEWYFYDDMRNEGRLRLIGFPDLFVQGYRPILATTAVVYFRRTPPNMVACNNPMIMKK